MATRRELEKMVNDLTSWKRVMDLKMWRIENPAIFKYGDDVWFVDKKTAWKGNVRISIQEGRVIDQRVDEWKDNMEQTKYSWMYCVECPSIKGSIEVEEQEIKPTNIK